MHMADDVPPDTPAATALANVGTEYPGHLTPLTRGDGESVDGC